jgi:hypothetical protein
VVDIFDEVDEELRAERTKAFLKQYAGLLIGACFLVVAATGGWKAWTWYQERQDIDAATRFLAAAARAEPAGAAGPNRPEAIAGFESVAAKAPEGYQLLARLRIAGLRADSGDVAGASAIWDQVAADRSADPLLRDLASLTWCRYHADDGDPAVLEGRLKPLTAPGAAWRSLAQEQMVLLDLRRGQTDAARNQLKKLAEDVTAPDGVRGRSSALLDRLGG